MAQLIASLEAFPGVQYDTGIVIGQTEFVIVRNASLRDKQVQPWGYANYVSIDQPIGDTGILFWSKDLIMQQTAIAPRLDYVPAARLWVYILQRYPLTSVTVEVYNPFDP